MVVGRWGGGDDGGEMGVGRLGWQDGGGEMGGEMGRAGNSLFGFPSESHVFLPKNE